MDTIFHGDWNNLEEMLSDFNIGVECLNGCDILYAEYTYEYYTGSAYVLLQNKFTGKLYEVYGGHCSCYGLEDQWDMEETSVDFLKSVNVECDQRVFNSIVNDLENKE